MIAAVAVAFLLTGCACQSTWFRRCGPPREVPAQVIEYSIHLVDDEPLPWRLCYRYGSAEPWVQVWGSPGFESREAAELALLEALE